MVLFKRVPVTLPHHSRHTKVPRTPPTASTSSQIRRQTQRHTRRKSSGRAFSATRYVLTNAAWSFYTDSHKLLKNCASAQIQASGKQGSGRLVLLRLASLDTAAA